MHATLRVLQKQVDASGTLERDSEHVWAKNSDASAWQGYTLFFLCNKSLLAKVEVTFGSKSVSSLFF